MKFEKVSLEQYSESRCHDRCLKGIQDEYDGIKIPSRSTLGSAGYDFHSPVEVDIPYGESVVIKTGVRCQIRDGWVLVIVPRSGQGFKTGISLANTVGVIDSDYYGADNEGHIMVKLSNNNSTIRKPLHIDKGQAFCQGIFLPYGITDDDSVSDTRVGGLGSTDNK